MTEVTDDRATLASLWTDALRGVVVRHPNPTARPVFRISEDAEPLLLVSIGNHRDTRGKNDGQWSSFVIANVRLTFFPGVALARQWLAAAWLGYMQHESLELVEVDGVNPLDPHQQPDSTIPWNRGLRDGLPPVLTPETLLKAFCAVMDEKDARCLIEQNQQ